MGGGGGGQALMSVLGGHGGGGGGGQALVSVPGGHAVVLFTANVVTADQHGELRCHGAFIGLQACCSLAGVVI